MKSLYRISIFFVFLLGQTTRVEAQCAPFDNCADANCLFNKTQLEAETWSNTGFTSPGLPGFCGTTETDLWFPVYTDNSGVLEITVTSSNCQNGNGLQVALYEACPPATPIACNGGSSGAADIPLVLTATVNAGGFYYLMVDGYAGDICDFTITATGVADAEDYGIITGRVLVDTDLDCEADSTDTPAPAFPVTLTGNLNYMLATNAAGQFFIAYTDTGTVALALNDFPGNVWTACENPVLINPPFFPDSTHVDFLIQPVELCAVMQVNVGIPPFFRPCQVGTFKVDYCNLGSAMAEHATVEVVVPWAFTIESTSLPIAGQSGDTLIFNIGDVAPLQCGSFSILAKPACTGTLIGQSFCIEAHAYPDTFCVDPGNWSGAHVTLAAQCLGDTLVRFTLKNTGSAPMVNMSDYIIIEDEVVLRSGEFQLGPGESIIMDTLANGSTWRMEAGQEAGHPGFSNPAVSLEGCGGLTPGLIAAFPQDDEDLFVDIECAEMLGSYDPNLKVARPGGVGPNRLLRANTPLEYTIYFQNTGTDTAFYVRLVDVLPPTLDPLSFRPGASSHPCTWHIKGSDTLEILFSPIMLPDSNVNEPASHGYFEFSIRQQPDLADGTILENRAAIYFDYNDPVITDPAWHTIGQLTVSIDPPANPEPGTWNVLGNPTLESCIFQARNPNAITGKTRFELYDGQGRVVRTESFGGPRFEFRRQNLSAGNYVFRLIPERGAVTTGKIVLVGY